MIIVYYRVSSNSDRKALSWFNNHEIKYSKYKIRHISKDHILKILSLTTNGLDDLVKHQGSRETIDKVKKLENMSLGNAVDYMKTHPEIIRTPIIFSENKLLIGFHEDNIRKFIPKSHRCVSIHSML